MAVPVYTDALEFLEEERGAWAPYEALDGLTDDQLERPTDPPGPAHGWSGRDLAGHVVACQESLLVVVKELALADSSPTIQRWAADAGYDLDAQNARWLAEWGALPLAEVRRRLREVPGELRGYLTVVPEVRWLKNPDRLALVLGDTIEHYEEHRPELASILAAADR